MADSKAFAIFKAAGKQYKVSEGDVIAVDLPKSQAQVGETVDFTDVIMTNDTVGSPLVDQAKVVGKILKNFKTKKTISFYHNPRKNFRNKKGHRQNLCEIQIEKI